MLVLVELSCACTGGVELCLYWWSLAVLVLVELSCACTGGVELCLYWWN